jgi:hypothetical protein
MAPPDLGEAADGLNQVSFARFEWISIRKFRLSHNRFTLEFTTAVVRCRLAKPAAAA